VNTSPKLLSYTVEGCSGEFIGEIPAGLRRPVVRTVPPADRVLTKKETKAALAKIGREWVAKDLPASEAKGHQQRTAPGTFMELTDWSLDGYMDATTQKLGDRLALGKAGHDTVILFRQGNKNAWPHVMIKSTVNLDRFPWLTWRQLPATAPGAFAVKVIDLDSGDMRTLYGETYDKPYDYHAENLKTLFGGGTHRFEIRWYPLGSGMKSALETDFFWAEPGQFAVMAFMRCEAD